MPNESFNGLRVLSLESRRAQEMSRLIETYGGKSISAPAMREVPLDSNPQALEFADNLIQRRFDMVIFLTGVGVRALLEVIKNTQPIEPFLEALRRTKIVARGPKPVAALRELNVPVTITAPEPNTWREVLHAIDSAADKLPLRNRRVAVQEYGISNPELLAALQERGAAITCIPVYRWALPENTEPLRGAIQSILRGEIDVVLFTTGVQITHLFQVAAEMNLEEKLRESIARVVIASIGPSTSETLQLYDLKADLEASPPKMGFLIKEAAERSPQLTIQKQQAKSAQ